ncbi:chemoreceptor protein, partial [Escherichia coli]|nr:chemoreceptor protein [Escherichia coli]
EQEMGIAQITLALSDLENVTQSNVAMVDELSGSSAVLKNQVIELQARTRNFRLEQENTENYGMGGRRLASRMGHSY